MHNNRHTHRHNYMHKQMAEYKMHKQMHETFAQTYVIQNVYHIIICLKHMHKHVINNITKCQTHKKYA